MYTKGTKVYMRFYHGAKPVSVIGDVGGSYVYALDVTNNVEVVSLREDVSTEPFRAMTEEELLSDG